MAGQKRTSFLLAFVCMFLMSGSRGEKVYDVIILGGGIAGVTAARTLVNEGVTDFIIIEGRNEIGGRMQSQSLGGYTMELGSTWIAGIEENTSNPMWKEAMKYHLDGEISDWVDFLFYDERGNDIADDFHEEFDHLYNAALSMYEHSAKLLNNTDHGDISVRSAIRLFGFNPQSPLQMFCEYLGFDFEFAYEPDILSAPFLDWTYDDFGYDELVVTDSKGYSSIAKSILADNVPDWQSKVHFRTVVRSIEYSDRNVTVKTNRGCFTAKKVIMTFSLGVLQHEEVSFKPNLPEWKWEVIHQFLFADYLSVYVKFNENITWFIPNNAEWFGYASNRRGYFPLWQNFNKFLPGSHILQATVTSNEARRLQRLTDAEVMAEAMSVLRAIFGDGIPDAEEILFSRLHLDPLFRGSYSSWPLGFTAVQHEALKAPVGHIYFAGEAYSQRYYGYTHGAMLSAEETTEKVVACLKDETLCQPPYVPPYTAKGCTYSMANNYSPEAKIEDGSCTFGTKSNVRARKNYLWP